MQIDDATLESAVSQVFVGALLLWTAWRVNGNAACARFGGALLLAAAAVAALALAPMHRAASALLLVTSGGVVVSASALVLCAARARLARNPHGRRWLQASDGVRVPLVLGLAASLPGLVLAFLLAPATLAAGWGSPLGVLASAAAGVVLAGFGRGDVEPPRAADGAATSLELLAVPFGLCSAWFTCLSFTRGIDVLPPLCMSGLDLALVLAGAWLLHRADTLARGLFIPPDTARP